MKGLEEVKETLAKFFLLVGKPEKKVAKPEKKSRQMLPQQQLTPQFKFSTQVKILSTSRKFFNRLGEVMRKVRYLNLVGKSGYFLLNTYQKPNILPSLSIGSVRNILLVGGLKHRFFSRMI